MRRVLQVCAGAVVVAAVIGAHVPVTGAQGIVSGVVLPPISEMTPGIQIGVAVAGPGMVVQPIMPGISVGMAGTGSGGEKHVTHKETRTSEPATIELSE